MLGPLAERIHRAARKPTQLTCSEQRERGKARPTARGLVDGGKNSDAPSVVGGAHAGPRNHTIWIRFQTITDCCVKDSLKGTKSEGGNCWENMAISHRHHSPGVKQQQHFASAGKVEPGGLPPWGQRAWQKGKNQSPRIMAGENAMMWENIQNVLLSEKTCHWTVCSRLSYCGKEDSCRYNKAWRTAPELWAMVASGMGSPKAFIFFCCLFFISTFPNMNTHAFQLRFDPPPHPPNPDPLVGPPMVFSAFQVAIIPT